MQPVESVNHIGIAVHSIDAQRPFYENIIGAKFESMEEIPSQKVRVAFFRIGDFRLELLEPTTTDGPIAKFLDKRGEGLHHIAFSVTDLKSRISELHNAGLQMIDQTSRRGAHNMQIAFIHPKSTYGVLMELCEPAK